MAPLRHGSLRHDACADVLAGAARANEERPSIAGSRLWECVLGLHGLPRDLRRVAHRGNLVLGNCPHEAFQRHGVEFGAFREVDDRVGVVPDRV